MWVWEGGRGWPWWVIGDVPLIFRRQCYYQDKDDCFAADATVELENGEVKTMAQLQIGDRVRTSATTFSDVHFFSHDDAEVRGGETRPTVTLPPFPPLSIPLPSLQATSTFTILTTASGHQIAMTGKHYVPLHPARNLTRASEVRIGHLLELADGSTSAVIRVHTERRSGLYNPHTLDGQIVVDGVVASCYTGSIEPTLAHSLLWPLRTLYALGVRVDSVPADEKVRQAVLSVLPRGH